MSVFTRLGATPLIIADVLSVLSTVHLNYQATLMTAEIGDEALDRVASLEAIAKSLP